MTSDELWELIQSAIETERQNGIDDRTHQADLASSVIAALASAGVVIGERVELTESEDQELARCIADADKNTLADPSFSALDDLLLIGLPKLCLALVRVIS